MLSELLLICLGVLLGATWTDQILQARYRQQAQERRRLNEERAVLDAARRQWGRCPRCGAPARIAGVTRAVTQDPAGVSPAGTPPGQDGAGRPGRLATDHSPDQRLPGRRRGYCRRWYR